MKRFLLADDNSNLRSALRLMLETRLKAPAGASRQTITHK